MGVTAIQVYPDLSRRARTTSLKNTNPEELREIEQLKLQMSIMQKTIDRLMDDRSQQNSRDDSSGTSVGQGIHLSPDQPFSSSSRSLRHSHKIYSDFSQQPKYLNCRNEESKKCFDVTIQARSSAELARKFRQVKQEKADILHRKLRERKGKNIQDDVQLKIRIQRSSKLKKLHPLYNIPINIKPIQ
ncbi:hypothetical protein KSP40_PGU008029 [Platanthera guangdongensis]|uniref:Uncharacterized protein n=1 Tax=Platanthera guangdongensis TaxID=2320717 RepID=A0ABR2LWX0_9ASPA